MKYPSRLKGEKMICSILEILEEGSRKWSIKSAKAITLPFRFHPSLVP